MLNIEYKDNLEEEIYSMIDNEFNKFATKNGIRNTTNLFIL